MYSEHHFSDEKTEAQRNIIFWCFCGRNTNSVSYSSTLKIKSLRLWNSTWFYTYMCESPPTPQLCPGIDFTFASVQPFWCFSDAKLWEMLRWRWRLAAETMAAQLQKSLCNSVFIGYFQYIYWLLNWIMLTVPGQVSYGANGTLTMQL